MVELALTITFLSDAELGTGLGTERMDGLLPRNAQGQPIVPAAHLKGLLRDRLEEMRALRGWPEDAVDALLGAPGLDGDDGIPSRLRVSDAVPNEGTPVVLTIARTALGPQGTVAPRTLRTVEAVAAGTEFSARAWVDDVPGGPLDVLTRLGLMAVEALGGRRTRGAGLCRIVIAGEERPPGELLREADALLSERRPVTVPRPALAPDVRPSVLTDGAPCWFQVIFRADSPICCPEAPIMSASNHIRSGPGVPASAVQGALLTRLDRVDSALARACFSDPRFRAWPLLPVLAGDAPDGEVPFGVRVDLTHRMGKLPRGEGGYEVRDSAIEPYHWSGVAGGSPLKSSDGILRREPSGRVTLWKAVDLPRVISSHSVHASLDSEGRRALFSVEALAPMVFSGLLALPREAAGALQESLAQDPTVAFGKARSIRGTGRLVLRPMDPAAGLFCGRLPDRLPGCVFVVQSPLALPDDYPVERAETALQYLAETAGWGSVLLDSLDSSGRPVTRTAATCGIRFGWNRHGLGTWADERHRRLRARRVILPGSVLVLKAPLEDLAARLLAGLGDGRECGFGALLPHPGMAGPEPYRPQGAPARLKSCDDAGSRALELFLRAGGSDGPAPSQIAALCRHIGSDPIGYLDRQAQRGSARHWHRWDRVFDQVRELVTGDPSLARRVLRSWQDLAIIHRDAEKERRP